MERSDELLGRAEQALDAITDEAAVTVEGEARRIARMMWFDGYKAGMDATKTLADDNFARLRAELS